MTERSEALLSLAERVAALLPPQVEDVVVTGSTSRGIADELSDIELLVISDVLPNELPLGDRQSWVESQRTNLRAGDALVLAQALVAAAEGILRVVFALNEEWEPGWKRLATRLEPLAVKPDRLAERIDAAIHALDLQALRLLAAETLALAPQTDQTRLARERLAEPL